MLFPCAGKRCSGQEMAMRHKQERLASLSSHWVMVDGWRMHYRAGGRGQQAVVLVHGLTVSGNYLLPTAAELLDDFAVYVPDLPGFGRSEKPRQVLDIIEMAEILRSWMDAVGLDRAYLMGNSLGCHTVAVVASRYRECVSGAILVSPLGDRGGRNTLRLVMRALNDFVREPPSSWAIMFRDFLKAGLRRTVLTLRSLQRFPLEPWLPQMQVPTLVVGGRHDRIVPMWSIGRVTALLPQGRVAVIPEAAHVPNYTHPEQLAALVRRFVVSSNRIGK
jgi:2-hydroxy-6-oxonona-2,4-dienedioate hydrolase